MGLIPEGRVGAVWMYVLLVEKGAGISGSGAMSYPYNTIKHSRSRVTLIYYGSSGKSRIRVTLVVHG
jgi:hypothetical protein